MKIYNKLVRDNIPAAIEGSGKIAHYRTLDDDGEYEQALLDKLIEEANEVKSAVKRNHLIEEIGDVMSVIYALLRLRDIDEDEVIDSANKKAEDKGWFLGRYFLEAVENKKK